VGRSADTSPELNLTIWKVASVFDIPILRFGQTYESMEKQPVVHFDTGETLAQLHQATSAMVKLDLKKAQKARDALRAVPIAQLIGICKMAAELYLNDTLPMGSGALSPAEFCRMQSATTGLPEHMCATNMRKNAFVLSHMDEVLDALTRGLPYEVLEKGYGKESRGVMVSYQANTPVFGMVLPNNSPGVHTLWLPALPMQIGLCIKPGSQEFWTPYRITEAFFRARRSQSIPADTMSAGP
jgi:acyl-CoA reductase-like NAD-dependent aldehyde dehydrogenase